MNASNVLHICNKAIRDGKYLARPHASAWQGGGGPGNVHPIKIENFDIFRDVISLLARVFILLIDTATQKYLKGIVSPVFEMRFTQKIDLHRSKVKVTGTVHCFLKVQSYHKN